MTVGVLPISVVQVWNDVFLHLFSVGCAKRCEKGQACERRTWWKAVAVDRTARVPRCMVVEGGFELDTVASTSVSKCGCARGLDAVAWGCCAVGGQGGRWTVELRVPDFIDTFAWSKVLSEIGIHPKLYTEEEAVGRHRASMIADLDQPRQSRRRTRPAGYAKKQVRCGQA